VKSKGEEVLLDRTLELAKRMMSDVKSERPTYAQARDEAYSLWQQGLRLYFGVDEPQVRVRSFPRDSFTIRGE
jgi:hypothetical protein